MKIPVHVRVFPGSDDERRDLVAAVSRHCACENELGGSASVTVLNELCPPHALLWHESNLKRLVFYRRWYRARLEPL